VPEREGEVTTEGGLDVRRNRSAVADAVRELGQHGIQASLFIDPNPEQVDTSAEFGAPMIELNTRAYSETCPRSPDLAGAGLRRELEKLAAASRRGAGLGLKILAGHGLTYRNVRLVSDIPEIEELNIGHNIIARAALVGLERAVREMLTAMGRI
jgi:pyridoxine 5-phosphate synthase